MAHDQCGHLGLGGVEMKTILVPGVGWPSAPVKPPRVQLQKGGRRIPMTHEEVQRLRQMRKEGKSLYDLEQIFRRGKATLISATFGRGPYAGY